MNYRLEQTDEGPRWIKLTYNRETEKIDREPLPVGESITLDPNDFYHGSEIMEMRQHPITVATKEDGTPYTFEELIADLEEKYKDHKFKPSAFYNVAGDILHIYWKEGASVVRTPEGAKWDYIEVHTDVKNPEKILGANIWGIKKILMEAFADA